MTRLIVGLITMIYNRIKVFVFFLLVLNESENYINSFINKGRLVYPTARLLSGAV